MADTKEAQIAPGTHTQHSSLHDGNSDENAAPHASDAGQLEVFTFPQTDGDCNAHGA
jgi:hypothetical protein